MRLLVEDQLPHVTSSVARFLASPNGKPEGMILSNGVEVHFSPHLSAAVLTSIHVGDRVTVYGILPLSSPMITAAVIEAANGERIMDDEFNSAHWA